MLNTQTTHSQTTGSSLENANRAGNALPPVKSFGDFILDSLFPNEDGDPLAPFDYEGFLRREGYNA